MSGRLDGKVAIVTGSTAGIGRASAERFAEEGGQVVINGRRRELGQQVAQGIKDRGGQAAFCHGDVTRGEDLQHLVRFALDTYGRIDILINNAYSGRSGSIMELSDDDWDQAFAVTVKAAVIASKAVIPAMIESGGGSIINVASVQGALAKDRNATYNALKAALINLSRQMAIDFGRQNIRVNALCPGRIVTEAKVDFLEANPAQKVLQEMVYLLGRPGTMGEAANAALFLASDESSFVTGHALVVDGGLTAQLQDSVGTYVYAALHEDG